MAASAEGRTVMIIHNFGNGDTVEIRDDSIVATFSSDRKVLSTSPHNGGYRTNLAAVFNHCAERTADSMRGSNYQEHIFTLAQELKLDPNRTCGISTGAYAENAA